MTPENAILYSWALEPVPAFALLLTALIYWRGWRGLHERLPHRYPAWRLVCFLGGLAAVYFALASPLDAFASFLLMSHMVQHMLLTMVAPPLILLGFPQLPLLLGLPRRFVSQGLGPFLHWPLLKSFIHRLMHPAVCWILFIASNVLWHLPPLYELALGSSGWHQFEHFCFLTTSLLFWWHVVQPFPSRPYWPRGAIIFYLALADIQNTALAAFLSFCEKAIYPTYLNAPRITSFSALEDQAGAGALMWVPGSIAFLVPAGFIAMQFLSRRRPAPPPLARSIAAKPVPRRGPLDLMAAPWFSRLIKSRWFRPGLQILMLLLAIAIILDGLLGPQISPMNLAGVLPWTHWRAFTVVALLAAGNLFCLSCPFTFVRDLGRRILPANRSWPRFLRTKWSAVILLGLYLWAYEAFDLWDKPAATALIIIGYFLAALVIDGFFRGASFCKYVCPIGQFHFVQSLASPLEIKIRQPDVCAGCRTYDCIKGNDVQRGCELLLFQPKKSGNMDCTFCLDCVKACPHDNVGIIAVPPARDLIHDRARSSVGRYARRVDLAALVLLLTFGAFANAAGMVSPVLHGLAGISAHTGLSELALVSIFTFLVLLVAPGASALLAAWGSSLAGGGFWRENLNRFAIALAPLGFGMWLAHFVFHFFTAALTPLPIIERILQGTGLRSTPPQWHVAMLPFYQLPGLELLFLGFGLLVTLYCFWRIACQQCLRRPFAGFLPGALLAVLLYVAGVWIIFQPMDMRGTLMS